MGTHVLNLYRSSWRRQPEFMVLNGSHGDAGAFFDHLIAFAESDPAVLGLAVTGSRAVGFQTENSDYDCSLFVKDDQEREVENVLGPTPAEIDLTIFTKASFAKHAQWGSSTAWDRYAWSIAEFRVDRTNGELIKMAQQKGRVPEIHLNSHVDSSLDWYLNQVFRSINCISRGDEIAGRLEAAESVRPFLQAAFALHDRRLVPYYKYLEWELESRPLVKFGVSSSELIEGVSDIVTVGSLATQEWLLQLSEVTFRASGYHRRFEQWETETWHDKFFSSNHR